MLFWGLALGLAVAVGVWIIRPLLARGRAAVDDRSRWLALAVLAGLPLGALGLYLLVGRPDLANSSVMKAQREMRSYAALVAELERRVAARPDDPEGHRLLALSQTELGHYADAAKNFERAIALGVTDAETFAGYGEALTLAANDVTPDAMRAFDHALERDPHHKKALYYRAGGFMAAGNPGRALEDWKTLMALEPAGSPLSEAIKRNMAMAEKMSGAAEVATLPPDQQRAAIEGMVARLAARLDAEPTNGPHDLEGWVRLVHAYAVLGASENMKAAQERAKALFAGNADALARLNAAAATK